jgi:hypothetical protein
VVADKLALISQKSKLAEAIRYALSRWEGLTRFIDDGHIELDNNTGERSIRPIALNRKNALFAGSDGGAEHWATIASLIDTCKLNDVDPLAYLADVLTKIVNGHPNSDIDQLAEVMGFLLVYRAYAGDCNRRSRNLTERFSARRPASASRSN